MAILLAALSQTKLCLVLSVTKKSSLVNKDIQEQTKIFYTPIYMQHSSDVL